MLFANKQNLETELKVSLLSIRERELVLYSNNCRNIAECTAILSGFALVTLTYERQTTFSGFSPISKGAYELINYLAIILNSAAMFGATTCAMLGPGLALRGADGAMDQAVEGLALEFRTTFILFFFGIVSYFCCFTVFLSMDFINGDMYDLVLHLLLIATFLFFLRSTFNACKRIYKKFRLPPEMTVSGAFDPDGRTRAHVTPEAAELDRLCERKRWWQWPRRQYLYFAVFMNEFVGISHAMFEERYMMNQVAPGTSRRPNNLVLHRILSYLEQPQARGVPAAAHAAQHVQPAHPVGGHHVDGRVAEAHAAVRAACEATLSDPQIVTSSTSGGARSCRGGVGSRGPRQWLRRMRGGEDAVGLAGSVSSELELASMSPSEHLNSGAISPAESGDGT